jgi:hypothetical protein
VTGDGVWIGNRIYWTLTGRNYKYLLQSQWVTQKFAITTAQKTFSVLTSRSLVEASNGGHSPSSGFPNSPRPQLPASHFSTATLNWLTAKLLLALASIVILGSESHGTHNHILLPYASGSLRNSQPTTQSRSYFTTGGLPPISSSWRQAHWGSRPEFVFATETLRSVPMYHLLWREDGFVSYECAWLLSSVRIAHTACYWKFFLLHYTQALCQYRLYRAAHTYLTYLMLQR